MKELDGALTIGGRGRALKHHRQQGVVERIQGWQQIEELEDKPDVPSPEQRERVIVERGDILPVDLHLASRRSVEGTYQVEQRRLATAARAHDADELT
jgi:hypothetical protein